MISTNQTAIERRQARVFVRVFVWAVLVSVLLTLPACAPFGLFSQTQNDSATSGEFTVYTSMSPALAQSYLRQFESRYPGADVALVTESAAGISDRLLAERDDPQADVVWGLSATNLLFLEWEDVLAPYAPQGASRIWSVFKDSSTPPYWVGFGAWMSAFCVNEEALAARTVPIPTSWEALRDPMYEGLLAIPDPTESGTGYMVAHTAFALYGEIDAWAYLEALMRNATFTSSPVDACTLAASGDIPIGVSYALAAVDQEQASDGMVAVFPEEGSSWDIEASALIRRSEIKPVAQTFLDWAISEEALRAYGEEHSILAAPLEDHAPPAGFPENPITLLIDKDFVWASANRMRILREWEQRAAEMTVNP